MLEVASTGCVMLEVARTSWSCGGECITQRRALLHCLSAPHTVKHADQLIRSKTGTSPTVSVCRLVLHRLASLPVCLSVSTSLSGENVADILVLRVCSTDQFK